MEFSEKEIYTIEEAKRHKLIPLTVWLPMHEKSYLLLERKRIGSNDNRQAMIVSNKVCIALFVNDMTGFDITTYNYNE